MKPNIREFQEKDKNAVKEIFSMYWTDPEFLEELSNELNLYINNQSNKSRFLVVEENDEVLGIAGYKKIPDYLKEFAKTKNPVELYIIAVKYKRKGIGIKLKAELIESIKEMGYSEILLFSPNSHKESWNFHDTFNFQRIGEVIPPEDELGQVWGRVL